MFRCLPPLLLRSRLPARPVASIPAVSSRQCSGSGLTELDAGTVAM